MKRTSDPIHLIETANPVPDPGRLPDGPETLMDEIVGMTGEDRQPRKRFRRPLVLSTAAVAVLLAGAAAWVMAMPEETTQIACNGEVIINARSGDPVADCAAEMRRQGIEPVNLSAYVNNGGVVGVFEEGADIPSSWRLLEDGFSQDTAIIALREALDDISTGVESACYSDEEAIAIVERELAASGLDWKIATRSNEGLNPPTCATAIVLPEDRQILVAQLETRTVPGGQVQEWQSQKQSIDTLAARLNLALDNECMTLNDAAEIAIGITFDVGAEYMTQIDTINEPDSACTTAAINVGGSVFLVLRGPADGPIDHIALPKPAPEPSAVAATPESVAREVWGGFVQEMLGGIGFDNQGVLISWGEDGSANAMAMNGAGRELIIGYEPWRSGEASADPKELQQVLGMPSSGTIVHEGVLFVEETTFVITVKLAVSEGVIGATIPVGTITSRDGDLDSELLSALVRTASPIARGLLGANPDQLEFVNYLPHPDE
jgi:hypothetical protein